MYPVYFHITAVIWWGRVLQTRRRKGRQTEPPQSLHTNACGNSPRNSENSHPAVFLRVDHSNWLKKRTVAHCRIQTATAAPINCDLPLCDLKMAAPPQPSPPPLPAAPPPLPATPTPARTFEVALTLFTVLFPSLFSVFSLLLF